MKHYASPVFIPIEWFLFKLFYLNKDWGCVILRESDFLLKICWSIPCLHPSWKVHTWTEICASLNHRKKTKADGSRLIPRKHTETLVLLNEWWKCALIVMHQYYKHHWKTVLNLTHNSQINCAGPTVVISKWYWGFITQKRIHFKTRKKRVVPGFFSQKPETRV